MRGEGRWAAWPVGAAPATIRGVNAPGVGVAAVIVDGDRVLLALRGRRPAAGLWSFPGGRLEMGESIAEGVRREVAEECGLEVEVGPLLAVVEIVRDEGGEAFHWVVLDYLARPVGGEPCAGDDARALRWATLRDLAALETTPRVPEIAARALAAAAAAP